MEQGTAVEGPSPTALRAAGALHANLNTTDLPAAEAFYARLGLTVRMRSHSEQADSAPLGLDRRTDSDAWFAYDHRGGRAAPALELVAWLDPPTAGDVYAEPDEVGLQAVGFEVPDLAAAGEATGKAAGPEGVGAVVRDPDGVAVELTEVPDAKATFRYVRLVCSDLEASTAWYRTIGFEPVTEATDLAWPGKPTAREQRLLLAGPAPLELRLTWWPDGPRARAHELPHLRGLFRMALRVDDVRAAVAAARAAGSPQAGDPVHIALPGTALGGVDVSFLKDPDGVVVEYVQP